MSERLTLQKGDCVEVMGLDYIHAEKIRRAFINAGGNLNAYSLPDEIFRMLIIKPDGLIEYCAPQYFEIQRILTIDQVLNATNSQPPAQAIEVDKAIEGVDCFFETGSFQDCCKKYEAVEPVSMAKFMENNPVCPNCSKPISITFEHGTEYTHKCGQKFRSFGNALFMYGVDKSEWDGEGLPPVGTRCLLGKVDEWTKYGLKVGDEVEIIAHYDNAGINVCAFTFGVPGETMDVDAGRSFRPIKSERDKVIHEAKAQLVGAGDDILAALYDADMLKMPEV